MKKLRNKTKQTHIQDRLTSYKCPECGGLQLVTKPRPGKDIGTPIYTSIIRCENPLCGVSRKVTRYPDGTFRSFKVKDGDKCPLCDHGVMRTNTDPHTGNKYLICDGLVPRDDNSDPLIACVYTVLTA